ncbi:uncharacterized protein LOC113204323 [Frankliniella occidentalis]|uniref:Uncharacterized protein LOC113204323 n=1 Tax=Frankliniella occidentalis TaxID=133901 RepID=A0A9C6XBK1_FRAOC|nr:uncharacterized protein LOC113204323 [Frankliniella occidentalis]
MAIEFSFTLVYRLVELVRAPPTKTHGKRAIVTSRPSQVLMVGSLVVTVAVSYLKPFPTDLTRAFCRYLMALLFGYIFVLTADIACRFLGGGVAAIAMFAFTVVGFALFTATAASLGYNYFQTTLIVPLFAILALDGLLLGIDAVLTYARVKRTSLVTAPKLSLR